MSETSLLTIALAAVPNMLAVLAGILINNSRLTDLRGHMDSRFTDVDRRFDGVDHRIDEMRGYLMASNSNSITFPRTT
jgi:hypothetical protein